MENRQTLKSGKRWIGFLVFPFALGLIVEIFSTTDNMIWNLIYLLICGIIFMVFRFSRRLYFDEKNFYIVRGNYEKEIPFTNIISLKKSSTKVNGERYWKLLYKDKDGEEHICRFFKMFGIKEFQNAIRAENKDIIIWDHPFFGH